jgi:hypothetical protein
VSWQALGGGSAAGGFGEARHAELGGCGFPVKCGVDLGQLALDAAVADLQPLDFAEPAFPFRLDDSGLEVVADLFEPGSLRRIWSQELASHASFSELALARWSSQESSCSPLSSW